MSGRAMHLLHCRLRSEALCEVSKVPSQDVHSRYMLIVEGGDARPKVSRTRWSFLLYQPT